MERSIALSLRSLAACLAIALGVLPSSGNAADPYELYALVPSTGSAAFFGRGIATSLSLAERSVNDAGGIDGRPIKFVTFDDQSNPQVAVQIANSLIAKNVPVILGPVTAGACNAVAAIAKNGPVDYCFSSATNPQPGSYMFAAHPATHDLLTAAARFLREQHLTKVAFITATDATGQADDQNFDSVFRAKDSPFTVVAYEHFSPSDISVAAQIARIKASGAQALLSWVVGTPLGTVLRNAADAGLDIPIVTSGGNLTQSQMSAYAAFLPKRLYFTGFPAFAQGQLPNGPVRTSVDRFISALRGAGAPLEVGNEVAWDPTLIVIDAIRKLGFNANAAQIRGYIANLRGWHGVDGVFDFRAFPQRGVGEPNVVVVQWDSTSRTWAAVTRPRV